MRVLVCGGRHYADTARVAETLGNLKRDGLVIIHGGASGADRLASHWASANEVEQVEYKALWWKHGPSAGPIRNQQMLDEGRPDLVIAFPGGRGTADMARRAEQAGVTVIEVPQ